MFATMLGSAAVAPVRGDGRWARLWRLRRFVRLEAMHLVEQRIVSTQSIPNFDKIWDEYLETDEVPRARRRAFLVWTAVLAVDFYRSAHARAHVARSRRTPTLPCCPARAIVTTCGPAGKSASGSGLTLSWSPRSRGS